MTERERLIELIETGTRLAYDKSLEEVRRIVKENHHFNSATDRTVSVSEMVADFLIENGVIVPPVKVGDTVYIFERGSYIIPICGQGKPHWEIKIEKCSFKYWLLDNHKFGVNMFFTREEAEKALKESEDNA